MHKFAVLHGQRDKMKICWVFYWLIHGSSCKEERPHATLPRNIYAICKWSSATKNGAHEHFAKRIAGKKLRSNMS